MYIYICIYIYIYICIYLCVRLGASRSAGAAVALLDRGKAYSTTRDLEYLSTIFILPLYYYPISIFIILEYIIDCSIVHYIVWYGVVYDSSIVSYSIV